MPEISLILVVCLGLIIVFFVLVKPLFLQQEGTYFPPETHDRDFSEATSLLEIIAELEADYKMGKVTEADYKSLSLDYKHRYLNTRAAAETDA